VLTSQRPDPPAGQATAPGDHIHEVLALGRGTDLPAGPLTPVPELVVGFARTRPTRTAVECAGRAMSYGALDAWAARIAARLGAAGIGGGARVAVLAEPSIAMVAGVLGIARAGAAYVPLDLAQPDRRIADVLADARPAAAVVTGATEARLAGMDLPLVRAEDDQPGSPPAPGGAAVVAVAGTDPAYLIYTSGSTGEPKGVLVEHGQLAASTVARRAVYPGAPAFLLVSPLAFDSSVAGLWGTLTAGGRLVIATGDEIRDPERLVDLIAQRQVTRLLCVPSLYRVILDAAERAGGYPLRSLDTVIVAGEPLPQTLVERHFAVHPRPVALVNEYGPTEATVWASYRWFDAPGPVSIGGPIPGARLYVLDDRLRPVPRGVAGELFIGGAGVSRGYFGRPDATGRAFIDDPFAGTAGARMYRTGDLVRWNAEGTLDFLGRRDHQVKIRGHRVELGAVEAALHAVPGVTDAVVVPDAERTALTGFVVAAPGTDPAAVRARLADLLPPAAVPARIRVLGGFPVTVNGKVDRAALAAAAADAPVEPPPAAGPAAGAPAATVPAATEGDTAAKVAAAWAEVLKVPQVPTEANFFDLGGNSLSMYQLQDALERHTGSRPSVVALFRHTTVFAQAALIRDGGTRPEESLAGMRQAAARRARAVRARKHRIEREAAK
jgi:amino acid adenylation domain-containing protein